MRPKILFLLIFLFTFLSYSSIQAQCPRGKVDVDCFGECGRFVDKDGDGICDLPYTECEKSARRSSQQDLPQIKANLKKIEPKKQVEDSSDKELNIDSLVPEIIIDGEDTIVEAVVVSIVNHENLNSKRNRNDIDEEDDIETADEVKTDKPYRLVGIVSITLLAYILTMMLVRADRIKRITHRKIWNLILLITFLMSCLLGFFLVIQINYGVLKSLYLLNLKLHVEFGIAMTLVAVIHIFWHLTYFKRLLGVKKTTTDSANE